MKQNYIKTLGLLVVVFLATNMIAQVTIDINENHLPIAGWQDTTVADIDGYKVTIYQAKIKDGSLKLAGSTQGAGPGYIEWTVPTNVGVVYNTGLNRRVMLYINDVEIDTIAPGGSLVVNHELVNGAGDVYKMVLDNEKQGQWEANSTDEIKWEVDFASSVIEESNLEISLFPNPVVDQVTILGEKVNEIAVINTIGMVVLESKEIVNNSLNVSELTSGVYILTAKTNRGISSRKFIKK